MTRSELIAELAAKAPGLTQKDVLLAVDVILAAISGSIAEGKRVEIRDFGSFQATQRPPRTAVIRSLERQ